MKNIKKFKNIKNNFTIVNKNMKKLQNIEKSYQDNTQKFGKINSNLVEEFERSLL